MVHPRLARRGIGIGVGVCQLASFQMRQTKAQVPPQVGIRRDMNHVTGKDRRKGTRSEMPLTQTSQPG